MENIKRERKLMLEVMENMEELLEVVSSEIPISNPKRETVEASLPRIRALISSIRKRLQEAPPKQKRT